ncbi:hypothetical protein GGE59_004373 [Rhizobium leguminosarum]|nr:hypothetical protein [Rhizobium leguminosarum]
MKSALTPQAADTAETIVAADILMDAMGKVAQHEIAGVVAEAIVMCLKLSISKTAVATL